MLFPLPWTLLLVLAFTSDGFASTFSPGFPLRLPHHIYDSSHIAVAVSLAYSKMKQSFRTRGSG